MKTALVRIEDWLAAVKADRGLKAASSCFLVAHQLSRKTSSAEFAKTGRLVTWQSIPTLAAAVGMSEPTVRRATRFLAANGHVLKELGHGPGRSNRYTLTMREPGPVTATLSLIHISEPTRPY